jgi:hypothetical protein
MELAECPKSDVLPDGGVHSTTIELSKSFTANTLNDKSTSNTDIESSTAQSSSPQEHVEVDSIRVDSLSLKVSDLSKNKIENSSELLESGDLDSNACSNAEKANFLSENKVNTTEHHLPTHTTSHKAPNQKTKNNAHMITPVHTPSLHDMNKTQSRCTDEPTSKKQKRNNKKSCSSQKGQNSSFNKDSQHGRIQLPLKPTQHAKQGPTRPFIAQQHTLRALISAKEAGKVIGNSNDYDFIHLKGKAGAQISAIRKESFARVLVSDNEKTLDRIVSASGTLDSVAKAFALIVTSILSESPVTAATQDINQLQISLGKR